MCPSRPSSPDGTGPPAPRFGGAGDWDQPSSLLTARREQAQWAGRLKRVFKGEHQEPPASTQPGAGGCAQPPQTRAAPGHLWGHPLALFGSLGCRDAKHWGWWGRVWEGEREGGQGLPRPRPHPLETPPSLCGAVCRFYSCKANIPGAHRASEIMSHGRIAVLPNEKMMTWPPALAPPPPAPMAHPSTHPSSSVLLFHSCAHPSWNANSQAPVPPPPRPSCHQG